MTEYAPKPRLNIRRGFARIARVAAVLYWIIAASIIVTITSNEARVWTEPREWRVSVANSPDIMVRAISRANAVAWVEKMDREGRIPAKEQRLPDGRRFRLLEVPENTGDRARYIFDAPAALKAGGRALVWAALLYAALLLAFRAIRWVAKGFMEEPA